MKSTGAAEVQRTAERQCLVCHEAGVSLHAVSEMGVGLPEPACNRSARLTTENMFHTLVDLAGISYPDERLEWSFVNPAFKLHKRYVESYGCADYDNAVMRGDCREVIDKGKLLKREH